MIDVYEQGYAIHVAEDARCACSLIGFPMFLPFIFSENSSLHSSHLHSPSSLNLSDKLGHDLGFTHGLCLMFP